jgi:hypothetical protein
LINQLVNSRTGDCAQGKKNMRQRVGILAFGVIVFSAPAAMAGEFWF